MHGAFENCHAYLTMPMCTLKCNCIYIRDSQLYFWWVRKGQWQIKGRYLVAEYALYVFMSFDANQKPNINGFESRMWPKGCLLRIPGIYIIVVSNFTADMEIPHFA